MELSNLDLSVVVENGEYNKSVPDVVIDINSEQKQNGVKYVSSDIKELVNISDKAISIITPRKKIKKISSQISRSKRHCSRNLRKQKSYIEKETNPDIEEVTLRDDKQTNKKTKYLTSTILVSDTNSVDKNVPNSTASNSIVKKDTLRRSALPVTTSFPMTQIAVPTEEFPSNINALVTSNTMSQDKLILQSPTFQTPILPTITENKFIFKIPSVPKVYEKPSIKLFEDFLEQMAKKIEVNSKNDEENKTGNSKKENLDGEHESKDKQNDDEYKYINEKKEESEKEVDKNDIKGNEKRVYENIVTYKSNDVENAIDTKNNSIKTINLNKSPDDSTKHKTNKYFNSSLGNFFISIGFGLVREFVQTDLLKQLKQKNYREGNSSINTKLALNSLIKNVEYRKKINKPYRLPKRKCKFCNFKTESNLVLMHHLEKPHINNYKYKCNYCPFDVVSSQDILVHMETEHNIRGRLEKAPAFHQCLYCPFEDNQKSKLAKHMINCFKKYKPDKNLYPPQDWEPPAKITRLPNIKQIDIAATATTYEDLVQEQKNNIYRLYNKLQSQSVPQVSRSIPTLLNNAKPIQPETPINDPNKMFTPGTSEGSTALASQFTENQVTQNTPSKKPESFKPIQQPTISVSPLPGTPIPNKLSLEQRYQIIQIYFANQSSIRKTYRKLRTLNGAKNSPSEQAIRRTVDRFRNTYSLHDAISSTRRKRVCTEEIIGIVNKSVEEDPNLSIRQRSQLLGLCPSTIWKILRKDLV